MAVLNSGRVPLETNTRWTDTDSREVLRSTTRYYRRQT